MSLRNIRPLQILRQNGVDMEVLDGLASGLAYILWLANVWQEFFKNNLIQDLKNRQESDWCKPNGMLEAHKSLDWYIWWAYMEKRKDGYLNSTALLDALREHPTFEQEPRYELVVLKDLIHHSYASLRGVGGVGRSGQGAIITTYYHRHLLIPIEGESERNKKERLNNFSLGIQMLTMHELGHVFGLWPGTGKENPSDEELKESHCQNECVMSWRAQENFGKKIRHKPFCDDCVIKLKEYFIES